MYYDCIININYSYMIFNNNFYLSIKNVFSILVIINVYYDIYIYFWYILGIHIYFFFLPAWAAWAWACCDDFLAFLSSVNSITSSGTY